MFKNLITCLLLITTLSIIGCNKKVVVSTPQITISTDDRIKEVLESNLTSDQKIQAIHDLLAREESRGQNILNAWKETLGWLAAIITLAVTR